MEKRKKANSIRKLLTLMLAFVLVFTGMGIGSWGVDQAWADGEPFEAIILKLKDGTTYEFIPNFEDKTAVCEIALIPTSINKKTKVSLKSPRDNNVSLTATTLGKNNWNVASGRSQSIKITIDGNKQTFKLSFKQGPNWFTQITYNYESEEAKAVVKRVEGQTEYEPVGQHNGQEISEDVVEEYAKASKLTVIGGTGKILGIEPLNALLTLRTRQRLSTGTKQTVKSKLLFPTT